VDRGALHVVVHGKTGRMKQHCTETDISQKIVLPINYVPLRAKILTINLNGTVWQ
jgi:hypothetical protein